MRKIKEILRLKLVCFLSDNAVARSLNVARKTVDNYMSRATKYGLLDWDAIQALSIEDLESILFPKEDKSKISEDGEDDAKPRPDFKLVHEELRKHKNVTLNLLWNEYKENYPLGYESSWFYENYALYKKTLNPTLRQEHKGGEKLFIDYCDGLSIIDPKTGKKNSTQLFVAVWGASNYTYAEASLSQDLPSWIDSHVRAFEYFGVVPHITVPDNLKSGVSKASRYEPDINQTYQELATHYGFAVIPARPYRPRDKAKVEAGVLVAQRSILAVLRNKNFFSITELNNAIMELLEKLNTKPMQKLEKSRREMFINCDRPNALALPKKQFEFASWKKAKVNIDYHIEIDKNFYSVPYRYLHQTVDVRLTKNVVEIFKNETRIATHIRSTNKHLYATIPEHMPDKHQKYLKLTPSKLLEWAQKSGPSILILIDNILNKRRHPEQGYRAALGVLRLEKHVGRERLEKAAKRAVQYRNFSYRSVKNILTQRLEETHTPEITSSIPEHENIRGGNYYENNSEGDNHA